MSHSMTVCYCVRFSDFSCSLVTVQDLRYPKNDRNGKNKFIRVHGGQNELSWYSLVVADRIYIRKLPEWWTSSCIT